jgi:ligand-binding sensor domain-containing protein/AraC-like DNA-binding protein
LLLFWFGLVSSQNKIQLDKVESKDGILNNWISNVFEDHKGFIWISTQDGVSRYDGHELKTLRNSPVDTNSISSNWVVNTIQDKQGDFWFGTYGGGLNKLDAKTSKITRFNKDQRELVYTGSIIKNILFSKNDDLWILSDQGIHLKSNSETNFQKIPLGKPWSLISMTQDGKIWITKEKEVHLYDQKTKTTTFQYKLQNNITLLKAAGNSLIALTNKKAYLSMNKTIKRIIEIPNNVKALSNFKEEYGYIATNKVVYKYIIKSNTLQHVYSFLDEVDIQSLFIDSKDQLWIGTDKGLFKENTLAEKFKHPSIPYNARRIVSKDSTLYLGGAEGLHIIRGKSHQSLLKNINISSLHVDKQKTIWVGDLKGTVYLIDSTYSMTQFKLEFKGYKNTSHIYGIVEDRFQRMWFGTWNGIYITDKKGILLHYFKLPTSGKKSNYKILKMLPDSRDRLWVIGATDGLFKIKDFSSFNNEGMVASIKNYTHNPRAEGTLNSNILLDIHEDHKGNIWIGTDAGLNFYNEEEDTFEVFYHNGHLFDEKIMSIQDDSQSRIWISTITKGIFVYHQKNNSFVHYKEENGLVSNGFLFSSSTIDANGNLYFGSDKGIQIINPDSFNKASNIYNPLITDFNLLDAKATPISTLFIHQQKKISLKHDQNDFSISFSALNFTNTAKINYAYKLENLDDTWRYTKNNSNTAYFTNINKGTYTFKVKAFDVNQGLKEGIESSIAIVVFPAWYDSTLAYIIYGIVFFCFIFLIYYLQLQRKISQFKIEQLKKEEETKLQKLITNFHYLGLTSVFTANDLESIKNNQSEIYGILSYFATSLFDKNNTEEVLKDITKNCISKLHLEDCVIYLINSNKKLLIQKAAHGTKHSEEIDSNIVNPMNIPIGEGIVGTVAVSGVPELVPDTSKDNRYIVDTVRRNSEIAVPIFLNGKIIGVIDSEHSKKNFFTKGHLEVLKLVAVLLEKKLSQIANKNNATITNDNIYFKELKQIMEHQKLYRKPTISLVSVAHQLNISSSYLSLLINKITQSNFNDFINSFRVEEVKKKLKNPEFDNYSIISIGLESGFNSKSVFYKAFKKHTGKSPSEYRGNH